MNRAISRAMFLIVCLISTLGCSASPVPQKAQHTALYIGQCHNVTHNLDGKLKVLIARNDDAFTGFMSISGHLVGTGNIAGTWNGNDVVFRSQDPSHNVNIKWQAKDRNGTLSGEYFVEPRPSVEPNGSVGEWSATLLSSEQGKDVTGQDIDPKDDFRRRFIFDLEVALNEPVLMPDGTSKMGAQVMFDEIHPVGLAVSITVNDIDVVWRDDAKGTTYEDLYKYTVSLTLNWQGPITAYGTTDIRMTYNAELGTYTNQEIVRTDGLTNDDAADIAYGVGRLIGEVAINALLGN